VGKTKRELNTRICEHKSSSRNHDEKSPVARHFNCHNHGLEVPYVNTGIELVKVPHMGRDKDKLLLQRDTYWLDCLGTLAPAGLNEEWSFSCFFVVGC
jgi:hypothetical protein